MPPLHTMYVPLQKPRGFEQGAAGLNMHQVHIGDVHRQNSLRVTGVATGRQQQRQQPQQCDAPGVPLHWVVLFRRTRSLSRESGVKQAVKQADPKCQAYC